MIAASAAASISPRMPAGSTALTIVAKARSGSASGGRNACPAAPIVAPGNRVRKAVKTDVDAAIARDLHAARGEYALPAVLPYQDTEEIQREERQDFRAADVGQGEKLGRQARVHAGQAAGVINRRRQQHQQDADRLDHELHDVGRGQRPHAAEHRVGDHDAAAHQDRRRARNPDDHFHDRAHRDRAGHDDHQIVGGHHHAARDAGGRPVAASQQLGDREQLELEDARHQHQAHHDHAEPVHEDQPHAGDAVDVAELDATDRGAAAEDHCGERAGIQDRPHRPARHQEVLLRLGLALRPDPDDQDADQVRGEYQQIQCHHAK